MLLISAGVFAAQSSSSTGRRFENQYLTITILPAWTVGSSVDQRLNLIQDKYLLSINPIFTHASGVTGGRFSEIDGGMPSVERGMANVAQPSGRFECAQWPPYDVSVDKRISLRNLYSDSCQAEK